MNFIQYQKLQNEIKNKTYLYNIGSIIALLFISYLLSTLWPMILFVGFFIFFNDLEEKNLLKAKQEFNSSYRLKPRIVEVTQKISFDSDVTVSTECLEQIKNEKKKEIDIFLGKDTVDISPENKNDFNMVYDQAFELIQKLKDYGDRTENEILTLESSIASYEKIVSKTKEQEIIDKAKNTVLEIILSINNKISSFNDDLAKEEIKNLEFYNKMLKNPNL